MTLASAGRFACDGVLALGVAGVSFEDDIAMEDELSMSVEELLQFSLDSLCDDVIRQHSSTQTTASTEPCWCSLSCLYHSS